MMCPPPPGLVGFLAQIIVRRLGVPRRRQTNTVARRAGWDRHETPCLTVSDLVLLHFTVGGDDVKLVDVTAENWRFRTQAWRERAVSIANQPVEKGDRQS